MQNIYCKASQNRDKIQSGAEHTKEYAVATPTESGVFSRPKFGNVASSHVHGLGLGVVNRKATSTAYSVCSNPVPPNDLNSQRAGFQSQYGAKTMANITTTSAVRTKPFSQAASLDGLTFSGFTPENCQIPHWLPTDKGGYRIASNGNGGKSKAHRLSYRLFVGPIPDGHLVLHRCGNASCINPYHLYLGSHKQNSLDTALHGTVSRGVQHSFLIPQTKLKPCDVLAIRESTKRVTDLAIDYEVSKSYISSIRNGRARFNVVEG